MSIPMSGVYYLIHMHVHTYTHTHTRDTHTSMHTCLFFLINHLVVSACREEQTGTQEARVKMLPNQMGSETVFPFPQAEIFCHLF
jgi:hypothetical protein